MIPIELRKQWQREVDRREVIFLADHGGGWPDALGGKSDAVSPEERLAIQRGLGFRVMEEYLMPQFDTADTYDPWCRLTNDVGVQLSDGFVVRRKRRR